MKTFFCFAGSSVSKSHSTRCYDFTPVKVYIYRHAHYIKKIEIALETNKSLVVYPLVSMPLASALVNKTLV